MNSTHHETNHDVLTTEPSVSLLKTLNRNTRRLLTAMDLPSAYRPALNTDTPERNLPLKNDPLQKLQP